MLCPIFMSVLVVLWTRRLRLSLQGQQVAPLIFELSLVDLTGTTICDNTDEVFNNNDSNRDCVGNILSAKFSNWRYFRGMFSNELSKRYWCRCRGRTAPGKDVIWAAWRRNKSLLVDQEIKEIYKSILFVYMFPISMSVLVLLYIRLWYTYRDSNE